MDVIATVVIGLVAAWFGLCFGVVWAARQIGKVVGQTLRELKKAGKL